MLNVWLWICFLFFPRCFHQENFHGTWKNLRLQPRNQRLETRLASQICFTVSALETLGFRRRQRRHSCDQPCFWFSPRMFVVHTYWYSLVLHISTDVCRPLPPLPKRQVFQTWHDRKIFTSDIPYHHVYVSKLGHGLRISLSSTTTIPHAHHIPSRLFLPLPTPAT